MTSPDPTRQAFHEALALLTHEVPSPFSNGHCLRLEFSSRGDRVPATLLVPEARGRPPLVVLQPGDAWVSASQFGPVVEQWLAAGAAVLGLDLPLHGERASAKLTERLRAGLGRPAARAEDVWLVLWNEFAHQARADLARGIDAVASTGRADASRLVCVGTGLGAVATAAFCGVDARPAAAALGWGPGPLGAAEALVCKSLPQPLPCPVALVGENDGSDALAGALGTTGKRIAAAGAETDDLLRAMTPFVLAQLGLDTASAG